MNHANSFDDIYIFAGSKWFFMLAELECDQIFIVLFCWVCWYDRRILLSNHCSTNKFSKVSALWNLQVHDVKKWKLIRCINKNSNIIKSSLKTDFILPVRWNTRWIYMKIAFLIWSTRYIKSKFIISFQFLRCNPA